jgi:DNA-binding NarL/FixJ family response regulator
MDGDVLRIGTTALLFRSRREAEDDGTAAGGIATMARLTEAERRVLTELCRPMLTSGVAWPATNLQISQALTISAASVKTHMRALFVKLDVRPLPQNQKRAALAQRAIEAGLVSVRDFSAG